MPWPDQMNRFPLFKIERVHVDSQSLRCDGRITNGSPMPDVDRRIWLAIDLPNCVYGDVVSVNPATREVSLTLQEDGQLTPGSSFPLLDGYHGGDVAWMVLDEKRTWHRQRFEPRDAVATPGEDGYTCLKPTQSNGFARYYPPAKEVQAPLSQGQVVAGGWDHEHCRICMATISPNDEQEGYVDDEGNWVCTSCYLTYVMPHDLAFISQPY